MKNTNKVLKKKSKKKNQDLSSVTLVHIYILAGFSNIHISICYPDGKVIIKSSAGANGFKGSKKSTPYAGMLTMCTILANLNLLAPNVTTAKIFTKGPGAAKESAIRALAQGIKYVTQIQDCTSVPHNGCTPPKARSV